MKIYLAGPMRGLLDLNFPEFYKYAAMLRAQGHEVFCPAEVRVPQDNIRAVFALEMDWLCREAEAIYLMPGWQHSPGARAEAALAEALGLTLMRWDDSPVRPPPVSLSQLGRRSSIISPSPSLTSPEFPSLDKNNTEPLDGIEASPQTRLMPLFVISLIGAILTAMGLDTLRSWLGGH